MGDLLPPGKPRLSKRMAEQHEFCRPADYAREVEALEQALYEFRNEAVDSRFTISTLRHETQEQEARIEDAKAMAKRFIVRGKESPGHPGDMEYTAIKLLSVLETPLDAWPDHIGLLELRELREAYTALARKHQEVCEELARRIHASERA